MQQVFVDTNAWMAVGQHKLSLFEEIERLCGKIDVLVLQGTIDELHKIHDTTKGKDKAAAKLALQIIAQKIARKELQLHPNKGYVDDLLVKYSQDGALVVTADFVLQKRLKKPFIIVKQYKFLELKE